MKIHKGGHGRRSQHGGPAMALLAEDKDAGLAGQFLLSAQGFRMLVCRVLHPCSPLTQLSGHPRGPLDNCSSISEIPDMQST